MSASIVSERNINKIVNTAAKFGCHIRVSTEWLSLSNPQVLEKIGQMLTDENYRSVNYRYNETDPAPKFIYSYTPDRFSLVELLKALDCLEYESCEHPEWKDSQALRLIDQTRGMAIRALPGYEEAAWIG